MGVITTDAMGAADDIVVVVPIPIPVVVPVVDEEFEFTKGPLDTEPIPLSPSPSSPFPPPPPPKLTTAKIIPTTIAITIANAPALINLPLLLSARFN